MKRGAKPRAGAAATRRLVVRLTDAEHAELAACAATCAHPPLPMAELVRDVALDFARRRLESSPGTCPYGRTHHNGPCSACTDG